MAKAAIEIPTTISPACAGAPTPRRAISRPSSSRPCWRTTRPRSAGTLRRLHRLGRGVRGATQGSAAIADGCRSCCRCCFRLVVRLGIAALITVAWMSVRQTTDVVKIARKPAVAFAMRSLWLSIAVLGAFALLGDISDLREIN